MPMGRRPGTGRRGTSPWPCPGRGRCRETPPSPPPPPPALSPLSLFLQTPKGVPLGLEMDESWYKSSASAHPLQTFLEGLIMDRHESVREFCCGGPPLPGASPPLPPPSQSPFVSHPMTGAPPPPPATGSGPGLVPDRSARSSGAADGAAAMSEGTHGADTDAGSDAPGLHPWGPGPTPQGRRGVGPEGRHLPRS